VGESALVGNNHTPKGAQRPYRPNWKCAKSS
jgi:hypothetical protein